MAKVTLIKNNKVINVIEVDANWTPPSDVIVGPEEGEIGDTFDGIGFTAPPQPKQPVLSASEQAQRTLHILDMKMTRTQEDIIETLVAKGVVTLKDFPQQLQDTLSQKKLERAKL